MKRRNKPKALFIQPPVYDFALYDLFLKPYGLMRVARLFSDTGYSVAFLNCLDYREPISGHALGFPKRKKNGTGKFFRRIVPLPRNLSGISRSYARYGILPELIEEGIAGSDADIVLVSTMMTYWYPGLSELTAVCRRLLPGVPVVAGGPYATLMPVHCRDRCGVDELARGEDFSSLERLLVRRGLPVPAFGREEMPDDRLLDCGLWGDAGVLRLNKGCPMSCDYCASGVLCSGFSPGNPDTAFERLMEMNRSCSTVNIAFYDDALLVHKDTVIKPFLRRVIDFYKRGGSRFYFYCPNALHIRYLDGECAELMVRAGFREVRLGFESSRADFHAEYDRKLDVDYLPECAKLLRTAGFSPQDLRVYILAGLPGQHAAEAEESIRYAAGAGLQVSLAEYSPVPESPLWQKSKECSRFDLEEEPLFHNNSFFPMEWDGFSRGDLHRLKTLTRTLNARLTNRGSV